jgi:putative nucleotidyltransferase with HDIG domain
VSAPALPSAPQRELARRPHVTWWASLIIGVGFALVTLPVLTADRWIAALGGAQLTMGERAPITVRVPPFFGGDAEVGEIEDHEWHPSSVLVARGDVVRGVDVVRAQQLAVARPGGALPCVALFLVIAVLAGLFSHHLRRTTRGRLVRVQVVNLALVALLVVIVKIAMLVTAVNILVVPVAVLALAPTLVLDRIVGLATGTLAALLVALCVPFDVGVALILLVQATTAGLMIAERPTHRIKSLLVAGGTATVLTALTYPVLQYLTTSHVPWGELAAPTRSAWIATMLGPVIATALAGVIVPSYQLLVGEITEGKLIELEDLAQPLLKQIAEKSPGSWQHSLMMAKLAEVAADAIGANARLVRVGAYYHDLGKSLAPKYFVENLEPGETSPHDKLAPEASSEAIFAHVTAGIVAARKAGLHERVIDFMHMHHGNGVLEYFWAKCQEQGNPKGLTLEAFRYPGVPPQTRETAILAICDAVEAASRAIKRSDSKAPFSDRIDALVQRIVYGKLHLGQLDESGLSMRDLRRMTDSLRETVEHANHGQSEEPWQHAEQDASATPAIVTGGSSPPLDSLDRSGTPDAIRGPDKAKREATIIDEIADTEGLGATPKLRRTPTAGPIAIVTGPQPRSTGPQATLNNDLANSETSPVPLLDAKRWTEQLGVTGREPTQPLGTAAGAATAADESRGSRDSRREADRLAMGQRYAIEPTASRDSGNLTSPFELDDERGQPIEPAKLADPMTSRDGSMRAPKSTPSDGDVAQGETRSRANKRTNEPTRRRASGDFVDAMVMQPIASEDTGRHASTIAMPDSSKESDQFAAEAARALAVAAPDLDVLPPIIVDTVRDERSGRLRNDSSAPAIRKRAATIPPTPELLRPPTLLSPRRAPTVQPGGSRPPTAPPLELERVLGKTLLGGVTELRPPAQPARDDDAATTHPSMAVISPADLATVSEFNRSRSDAAVTKPHPRQPADDDRETETEDDTRPALQLPLPAPSMSDPAMDLGDLISPPPRGDKRVEKHPSTESQTTWARGLAARIDGYVDEFSQDTPARPPTRGELQASSDAPPDATRQQSLDEIELLQRSPIARRSSEELEFSRRAPYPTTEVREEDIEAAIEIAPSARRTGVIPIGIAKKKSPTE